MNQFFIFYWVMPLSISSGKFPHQMHKKSYYYFNMQILVCSTWECWFLFYKWLVCSQKLPWSNWPVYQTAPSVYFGIMWAEFLKYWWNIVFRKERSSSSSKIPLKILKLFYLLISPNERSIKGARQKTWDIIILPEDFETWQIFSPTYLFVMRFHLSCLFLPPHWLMRRIIQCKFWYGGEFQLGKILGETI